MEDGKRQFAEKRVKILKRFYSNIAACIGISIAVFIINLVTTPTRLWFYWVIVVWGIVIIIHAIYVFIKLLDKEWEEKKIKQMAEEN